MTENTEDFFRNLHEKLDKSMRETVQRDPFYQNILSNSRWDSIGLERKKKSIESIEIYLNEWYQKFIDRKLLAKRIIQYFQESGKKIGCPFSYLDPYRETSLIVPFIEQLAPDEALQYDAISACFSVGTLLARKETAEFCWLGRTDPEPSLTFSEEARVRMLISQIVEHGFDENIIHDFCIKESSNEYRMNLLEKTLACTCIDKNNIEAEKKASQRLLDAAHQFFDYIVSNQLNRTEMLAYVSPLFDRCQMDNALFCEMRWNLVPYWEKDQCTCTKSKEQNPKYCYQDWQIKSPYLVFLKKLHVHPYLPRNNASIKEDEWIPVRPEAFYFRICGWLNQYDNFPNHIACKTCGKTMRFDLDYSKAEHESIRLQTVLYCDNLECEQYQKKVYLNNCWNCGNAIDSARDHNYDPKFQYEDRYWICMHCGAAKKNDTNFIGTICPKCGESLKSIDWADSGRDWYKECPHCHHKIHAMCKDGKLYHNS